MTTRFAEPQAARTNDGLLVGVDIGGSKVAVLVVGPDGLVRGRVSRPSSVGAPDEAAAHIVEVIDEALVAAGAGRDDIGAVGVGVPGRVDRATGVVSQAVNLGWDRLPLGEGLHERLRVPVVVENDVRAAAAGLYARGTLGAVQDLAYLGIGTGISAGIVIGGQLHRGPRGMAGEIGHIVLEPDGPRCACGLNGCFEALAAGPAIGRRAVVLHDGRDGRDGRDHHDGRDVRDGTDVPDATDGRASIDRGTPMTTAAAVYAAASAGHPLGLAIADEVGRYVARAVHELVMAYDVEVVVLGGGVTRAGDAFLHPILRALDRLRSASALAREVLRPGVVHLLPPSADAGAWGAVTLAAEAMDTSIPSTQSGAREGHHEEVVTTARQQPDPGRRPSAPSKSVNPTPRRSTP